MLLMIGALAARGVGSDMIDDFDDDHDCSRDDHGRADNDAFGLSLR